jgi:hypothetical protein
MEPNPNCTNEGASILTPRNSTGDYVFYMGILINRLNPSGNYFVNSPNRVNLLLDIAKGKTDSFNENEQYEIAEFIKRGVVCKTENDLILKFPVFTKKQYDDLLSLIDPTTTAIAEKTQEIVKLTTDILVQHSPPSMRKEASNMGWVIMSVDGAVVAPTKIMLEKGTLQPFADNSYTASYAVTV